MYLNPIMQESIKKVEAAREANMRMDPRRMTAEEKDILLKTYHPDYRDDQFTELKMGPNKGGKVPVELAELLQGTVGGGCWQLSPPQSAKLTVRLSLSESRKNQCFGFRASGDRNIQECSLKTK